MAEDYAVTENLYLDASKERVVKEGDPAAAWLLSTPGMTIPAAEAQRLGLLPAESKQVHAPAEDKAMKAPGKAKSPAEGK